MKAFLIKKVAQWIGQLKSVDFDEILQYVITWDKTGKPGAEKALHVAEQVSHKFASSVKWALNGVVWLAYAYARITGKIVR